MPLPPREVLRFPADVQSGHTMRFGNAPGPVPHILSAYQRYFYRFTVHIMNKIRTNMVRYPGHGAVASLQEMETSALGANRDASNFWNERCLLERGWKS